MCLCIFCQYFKEDGNYGNLGTGNSDYGSEPGVHD